MRRGNRWEPGRGRDWKTKSDNRGAKSLGRGRRVTRRGKKTSNCVAGKFFKSGRHRARRVQLRPRGMTERKQTAHGKKAEVRYEGGGKKKKTNEGRNLCKERLQIERAQCRLNKSSRRYIRGRGKRGQKRGGSEERKGAYEGG